MGVRRLLLVGVAAIVVSGLFASSLSAATLYGGGSVPASVNDPVPLFLVKIENGRGTVLGRSGGACTNGASGLGHFLTHRFTLRKRGRFRTNGSFSFIVPGGVANGTYRIRGRVRSGRGIVIGTASVRVRFPGTSPGQTVSCKSGKRAFRARKPASKPRGVRGPFYGVTSQGLPIVLRPTADASALTPVAIWATVPCKALGPSSETARLRVPRTGPGVYAKTGVLSSSFIPALGSTVAIPDGTYAYTNYGFQTQIVSGRASGTISLSSQIGNAQKILIDRCAAPPIAFTAVP